LNNGDGFTLKERTLRKTITRYERERYHKRDEKQPTQLRSAITTFHSDLRLHDFWDSTSSLLAGAFESRLFAAAAHNGDNFSYGKGFAKISDM
jgi:hypothetical protein